MNAIELLNEAIHSVPELAQLQWTVTERVATASLFAFASMHEERERGAAGNTLVITPAPDALPWVTMLHEAGWKRGGGPEQWGWEIYAKLHRDDATLIVSGPTRTAPEHDNPALPYFAPAPPALSRRKGFVADYREWERKCFDEEW